MDNTVILLAKAQGGDMAAFEALLLKYEKLIYNLARRFMGNNEDAEDVTQEVAVKIYRNIKSCKGEEFLSAWISRITHNSCMDALRKRKGKNNESLDEIVDFGDGKMEKQFEDSAEGPEDALIRKELSEQIEGALMQLPVLYRSLVVLRDVLGHSYDEIAEIMGLPVGTVKSRLFRGRAKLKSVLLGMMADREQNSGSLRYKDVR